MLTPWKKSYDKPRQCIRKQRHHFDDKCPYSQSYGFSSSHLWMWEADHKEGWALKNWCFQTVVFKKFSRVPWTVRRSRQSVLKEINLEYSLEGLMLKLQCFGHMMWNATRWKRPWCWEKLKAGGEEDDRGWDSWMTSLTQWTWVWANSERQWRTGKPGVLLQSVGSQRVGHNWATEQQQAVVKDSAAFTVGPGKESRQLMLKMPDLPDAF